MALQPEIWLPEVVENFYQDNEFLNASTSEDQYIVGNRAVHIPQAGQPSGVQVNRTSLPAAIQKRTDTEVIYVLDELTTDPVLIPNIDEVQLSYQKRASVISNDMANLKEKGANIMLKRWTENLPASAIIRTTGAATAAILSGATGNRKLFTKAELFKAKVILDKQGVSKTGRRALLFPEQIDALLGDKDLAVNFVQYANLAEGIIGRVAGFDLYMRPTVLRFDNATPPAMKDPLAGEAATDNAGAICWHPSVVSKAMGEVKMFERLDDPTMYGNVYSFLMMLGGRHRRADGKGIVAIVEAPSA